MTKKCRLYIVICSSGKVEKKLKNIVETNIPTKGNKRGFSCNVVGVLVALRRIDCFISVKSCVYDCTVFDTNWRLRLYPAILKPIGMYYTSRLHV